MSDRRYPIIEEIWETEKAYVEALHAVVHVQNWDSLKNRVIIPKQDIPLIFSNIEQIFNLNQDLLFQIDITLEKGVSRTELDNQIISLCEIFYKMCDTLSLSYEEYCINNPQAIELLKKLSETNTMFQQFEQEISKSTNKLRLDGFIAKPVQRITKYPLLFKELLKNTEIESPTYNIVQKTLLKIEQIPKKIDEHKNQKENAEKLASLEKNLNAKIQINVSGRVVLKEGTLIKLSPRNGEPQDRKFYLFNDIIIYAKIKNLHSMIFKGMIPISAVVIKKYQDGKLQNAFKIFRTDNTKSYMIVCRNEYERNDWVKSISGAIYNLNQKKLSGIDLVSAIKNLISKVEQVNVLKESGSTQDFDQLDKLIQNTMYKIQELNNLFDSELLEI